ncbi:hypothetical protein [Shewanella frigidimarina]|nr:hypothetical protein [Shewanella frigidimarina]
MQKRKRAWMKLTFLEAVLKAGFSDMCKNQTLMRLPCPMNTGIIVKK